MQAIYGHLKKKINIKLYFSSYIYFIYIDKKLENFEFVFEFKIAINFEFIFEIFVNFEFNFEIFVNFEFNFEIFVNFEFIFEFILLISSFCQWQMKSLLSFY